jgi:hypothetical protein
VVHEHRTTRLNDGERSDRVDTHRHVGRSTRHQRAMASAKNGASSMPLHGPRLRGIGREAGYSAATDRVCESPTGCSCPARSDCDAGVIDDRPPLPPLAGAAPDDVLVVSRSTVVDRTGHRSWLSAGRIERLSEVFDSFGRDWTG